MGYAWKASAQVKIDAQAAGEEMEGIRVRNNGRLDPASVVDAARDKSSALHAHFEWDNRKAATAYREGQAGDLIRWIVIDVPEAGPEAIPIRAFVSVQRGEDRSYTSVQHALSDAELRAQVVAQAWTELEAWRKRHAELVEFARIFALIEQARAA